MSNTVDVDAVIAKCVAEIWNEYDKDGNNCLDQTETRKFMEKTLSEMSGAGGEISDADFD